MKESKISASSFSYNYGIGHNPLMKWQATPLPNGNYFIMRPNNVHFEAGIGDEIPSAGKVSVSRNKDLVIGSYTIPVGHNLNLNFYAIPANKEKDIFTIFNAKGKFLEKIKLGDKGKNSGVPISLDEFGNLTASTYSIKVLPMLSKLNFNLLQTLSDEERVKFGIKSKSVKRAVMGFIDARDLTNSTPTFGFYFPKQSGSVSGEFKEYSEGELVTTAQVFSNQGSDKRFNVRTRNPSDAYSNLKFYSEMVELKNMLVGLKSEKMINRCSTTMNKEMTDKMIEDTTLKLSKVDLALSGMKGTWNDFESMSIKSGAGFFIPSLKKTHTKEM
jgi:hypothetical protein